MRSTAFLLALTLATAGFAGVIELNEHPMDHVGDLPDDEQVDVALELLSRGADGERRWIAKHSEYLLMDLDSDEDDTWAITRMNRLREWIVREQDDFVLSLVLKGISDFEEEIAGALFLELLSHPSPNVRHRAVSYFTDWGESPAAIPILEQMWATEFREWIRDDLMIALAALGSTRFLDDFVAETHSDDATRAGLSVDALAELDGPRALTKMIELARDPRHPLRLRALKNLTLSDSSEARDILLAASRDTHDEVRGAAVNAFRGVENAPEFAARLLEVARSDANPDIRYEALTQLSKEDAEVEKILEAIVGGPRTPETESLIDYAERQLAPPLKVDPFLIELLERQRAGETIDLESYGYKVEHVRTSCGGLVTVDRETPGVLMPYPEPPRATVRCWSAPGVSADFFVNPRIEGNSLVTVEEYHEYQGDLWVQLYGVSAWGCWVPRERLGEVSNAWPPPSIDRQSLYGEFELFTEDDRFAVVRILEEHGTVEFFERDERSRTEAVAVDLRLTPSAILALIDSHRGTDNTIDQMVLALLRQVPKEFVVEPELRSRLDTLLSRSSRFRGARGR